MADARVPDESLDLALRAIGRTLAYPPTPALAPAVAWRLEASRAAGRRPPFPRIALWSRRRVLVLAAIGLLAVLALAFGARSVLGAAEVRVHPGLTPSGSPIGPSELGIPASLKDVSTAVGFEIAVPAGPGPDEAYLVSRTGLDDVALLAWTASSRYPALPDTPWGLVLMELTGDEEFLVKDVNRYEDLDERPRRRPPSLLDRRSARAHPDRRERARDVRGPGQRPHLDQGLHHLSARDLAPAAAGGRTRRDDRLSSGTLNLRQV